MFVVIIWMALLALALFTTVIDAFFTIDIIKMTRESKSSFIDKAISYFVCPLAIIVLVCYVNIIIAELKAVI